MSNIPRGVSGREPPLNRGQPDLSPPDPSTLRDSGTNQGVGDMNLELLRQMIERTERGNIRIRKLNELRRQRRISSSGYAKFRTARKKNRYPTFQLTISGPASRRIYVRIQTRLLVPTPSNSVPVLLKRRTYKKAEMNMIILGILIGKLSLTRMISYPIRNRPKVTTWTTQHLDRLSNSKRLRTTFLNSTHL